MLLNILLPFSALPLMANARMVMYLTGQHNVVPEPSLVSDVTHVTLAFMRSSTFNERNVSEWPLFTTVEQVRPKFTKETKIMIAIGGWGDTSGFSCAASTESNRKLFAQNVKAMVDHTGADGVDIDWEYPGGNGEDYKEVPNEEKSWEVEAYPRLLSEVRTALGPEKLISAAVPGLRRDMLAFTNATIPTINACLDYWNVMTYDLMNRRDNITRHHTGIDLSLDAVNTYLENGVPPAKVNLGFAFYLKWFRTDPHGGCDGNPIGCKTVLLEDPVTGAGLGQGGSFSWHDRVPSGDVTSFNKALTSGTYDSEGGGHYFWDSDDHRWWTWDTPQAIAKKFPAIMEKKKLGGVFAWGLGEDAPNWDHLKALTASYQNHAKMVADGLKGAAKQSGSSSSSPDSSVSSSDNKEEL